MPPLYDELWDLASELATSVEPRQANLRRSVSTAYYSLFHFLIHEATLNWHRPDQRSTLARAFDHGTMRQSCERKRAAFNALKRDAPPLRLEIEGKLSFVAETFLRLQEHRNKADYDVADEWSAADAAELIV